MISTPIKLKENFDHRLDLQFLRGFSVIIVFLYHLKIPGFQNGFLGVDIFFVLSGYFMAKLVEKSDPLEFYKRRLKRLLPAYLVVVASTTLIVIFLTVPSDSIQRTDKLFYDLLALSNFAFWAENSYFDSSSFKPLLNIWSLAVEIQFYLVAPFILPFLHKRKILLISTAFVSFLISIIFITISPKTSFFLLPTRFWEFIFGAFVAWYFIKNYQTKTDSFIVLFLILCILSVMFFFPIPNDSFNILTGHPGLAALIIVASTALIILIGFDKSIFIQSYLARMFIKVGDYSYSIYLTHFPIIILVNYNAFSGTKLGFDDATDLVLIISLTFFASYLLYNYVEKIRFTKYASHLIVISILITLFLGFTGPKINSLKYSKEEILIFNAWQDRTNYRCGKIFRALNPTSKICMLGEELLEGRVLLLGNSHADSIKSVFQKTMTEIGISTFFYVANNPLMSALENEKIIINEILSKDIDSVVFHFSPSFYEKTFHLASISSLVKMLKLNNLDIIFIAPVPVYDFHVPKKMYEMINNSNSKSSPKSYSQYLKDSEGFYEFVSSRDINIKDIWYPNLIFCPVDSCQYEKNGVPFYFDQGHLTLTGASELKPIFYEIGSRLKLGKKVKSN